MRIFISCFILVVFTEVLSAQHCVSGRYGEQVVFTAEQIEVLANVPFAEVENTFTGASQTLSLDMDAFF